jgi:UDP-N-acetylmuramate--alanine ligase
LLKAGATLVPQDGSGLEPQTILVVSTAVEDTIPEVKRAKELGCRIVHRSEALAEIASHTRCVAVSGTSGKSTVTAMVFRVLRGGGLDPSVISGGVLRELSSEGHWGNAWGGTGDWLVIEADESDGSLVRYSPEVGVMLNLDRDHKELSELRDIFATFRKQSKSFVVHGDRADCLEIAGPDSFRFGVHSSSMPLPTEIRLLADRVEFRLDQVKVVVPGPGMHMVENALAALAVGVLAGVDLATGAKALESFQGVGRRHELIGEARGVRVFDDFAHNPAKVEAGLAAAQLAAGGARVLAVFQPHGYGPLRFLLEDFAKSFAKALRPQDKLWISPVYDAGGTADRSISSKDLADRIAAHGHNVFCPATRDLVALEIAAQAQAGDLVYSMGARDPDLPAFAKQILSAIGTLLEND